MIDGILIFDSAHLTDPFYVRYEEAGGTLKGSTMNAVKFHNLPGVNTQPAAMKQAKLDGFNITGFRRAR